MKDPAGEIESHFGELQRAELVLANECKTLETQFLATSSELERLKEFGDQFVFQVEKLVGVATGRDCDPTSFSEGIAIIERASEFLKSCQTETEQMLATLRSHQSQISQLLAAEVELQRAMLPLKCVKTLFKVEAAPLGDSFQQMFTDLTHEMEGLNEQVREVFGCKFKQLHQIRQTIGRVIAQLDQQSSVLREVIAVHRAQIDRTVGTIKKELAANQLRDSSLRVLSAKLAREIDQIVMGLQFQDIVNQKLQHVAEALPVIQKRFSETPKKDFQQPKRRFRILRQACRLEARQLQGVRQDLTAAEASMQDGIRKVMNCVEAVDSQSLSLNEFEKLTTSCDGTVETLVATLVEVRELVASSVLRASEAYELLRPLGGFASDLTSNVRAMAARINLIGLNAQVQAAQACKDRTRSGLDVLSRHTYEIARETSRISEAAAQRLDSLATGLASSVKSFEALRASGLSEQAVLIEDGKAKEASLHSVRDAALQALLDIGTSLSGIKQQAERALDRVDFAKFYEETVPALEAPLHAIAAKAEKRLGSAALQADDPSLMTELRRNYTMASEHQVFEGSIKGTTSAGKAEANSVNGEIELFVDAPAPSPRSAEPAPATDGPIGDNIELF